MSSRTGTIRKRWKKRILAGEEIPCAICGEPIPAKARGSQRLKYGGKGAVSVDHIIPLAQGGTSRLDNLQPTHALCNYKKGQS